MPKYMLVILFALFSLPANTAEDPPVTQQLYDALMGDTPLVSDLQYLTDRIGGRLAGTEAYEEAARWAKTRFKEAGVPAVLDPFILPEAWIAEDQSGFFHGQHEFAVDLEARAFTHGTNDGPQTAPVLDIGYGTPEDFENAGPAVKGAYLLVHTRELGDKNGLAGLFAEYNQAATVNRLAANYGAFGLLFISSHEKRLLMRLNADGKFRDELVTITIDRESGLRAARLLENGAKLSFTALIEANTRQNIQNHNVIAEIRDTESPEEIVVIGAHLDSHELGTGALDNGANAMMLIDIARQMAALGLRPKRTIRFALWGAEEQGFFRLVGLCERPCRQSG